LTYSRVPDYKILSMFDMASLPFSCKFIMGKSILIQLPFNRDLHSKSMGKEKRGLSSISSPAEYFCIY